MATSVPAQEPLKAAPKELCQIFSQNVILSLSATGIADTATLSYCLICCLPAWPPSQVPPCKLSSGTFSADGDCEVLDKLMGRISIGSEFSLSSPRKISTLWLPGLLIGMQKSECPSFILTSFQNHTKGAPWGSHVAWHHCPNNRLVAIIAPDFRFVMED